MEYIQCHPLKTIAGGVPIVVSPLILYSDDFSGNCTKKWNKFDAWCLTLACLPMTEARKFLNIHFIACSNVVSAMDMREPLVEDLLTLERGVKMFDAHTKNEVLVIAPAICCLCDNVRASELLNHLGRKQHIEEIRSQTSEAVKRLKRTEFGISENDNPLLNETGVC